MSENSGNTAGWFDETLSRLHDAEIVVDVAPVGPGGPSDCADFISVKLQRGHDSDVLNEIIVYDHYAILSAYVSDNGELIIDITKPELYYKFKA